MAANETNGLYFEDLTVGMSATASNTVSEADIVSFAKISGDTNPVHLNEDYAKKTMFKTRIAHGILTASFISAVLGTKLPGPGSIYLSQNLKFKAPVKIGETVRTQVTVAELNAEKKRVTFTTTCSVNDKVVLEGEALIMVPSKAAAA
ncbi:MAG: MaoC family dehydratase [Dongiaceae bacterium]